MKRSNPYKIVFKKGTRKRLSYVYIYNIGTCVVYPQETNDKKEAINKTIDYVIDSLKDLKL